MDDLDDREAFLRGIFADPDNDLPRLVFADWLDERGEAAWAELIRVQCELYRLCRMQDDGPALLASETLSLVVRQASLLATVFPAEERRPSKYHRGFPPLDRGILVPADLLGDPTEFRRFAIRERPEWYGCDQMKVSGGRIVGGKPIGTILTSPVTEKVSRLDLSGAVVAVGEAVEAADDSTFGLLRDYEYRPVVTVQAVQALVETREARRLVSLDLRNNDLDNDAARAIVHSQNLIRLTSLQLFDGNQLRGRTWQQLLERFGPDVLQ